MDFKEKVLFYLREGKGHKAWATRLSKDLGRKITPSQVKRYMKKLEGKTAEGIKKRAKEATDPGAYEWGVKYKILLNHLKKQ